MNNHLQQLTGAIGAVILGAFATLAPASATAGDDAILHLLRDSIPRTVPFCAVEDASRKSLPGAHAYKFSAITYPMRKADGGLTGIEVTDGIGCDVTLKEDGAKVIVHVNARKVWPDQIKTNAEGLLLIAPTQKSLSWETDVDLTEQDFAELTPGDKLPGVKVYVSVQRQP